MKIYVASKFENKEMVREVQALLRSSGHTITFDWTNETTEGKSGKELADYLYQQAVNDVKGVRECNAIFVLNHPGGRGMWIEFGMALAWGKIIVIVFDERAKPIFLALPEVYIVKTIGEGLAVVTALGG